MRSPTDDTLFDDELDKLNSELTPQGPTEKELDELNSELTPAEPSITLLTDKELAKSGAEIERIPLPFTLVGEIDPNRVRPDPNIFSEFGAGVASARKTLGSQVFGVAGLIAESGVLGEDLDSQSGQLMDEAGRYSRLSAEAAPEVNEMGEIDGVGDFTNYAAGMLGSFLPDVGMMAASGMTSLGARTAAKAFTKQALEKEIALQVSQGLTKEAAKEAVELAVKTNLQNPETLKSLGRLGNWVAQGGAERLASKTAGYGVMTGTGIARQTADIGNAVYEAGGEVDPTTAILGGVPAGLMDAFSDIVVGGKFLGIGSVGKEVAEKAVTGGFLQNAASGAAKGIRKGILAEAPTEAAQQAIQIAAVKSKTGGDWTSDDFDQLKEAAFGGGVLGGFLGGAGGGVTGVKDTLDFKRHKSLEKTPAQASREKGSEANINKADNTLDTLGRLEAVDRQGSPTKATQAALADAARVNIEDDEDALDSAEVQNELKAMAKAAAETTTQQELVEQEAPASDAKLETTRPKNEPKPEPKNEPKTETTLESDLTTQSKLPKNLSKSSPRYSGFNRDFTLAFESDLDRAAYIVAGDKKSKAHEEFLKFGEANGFTREELVSHGKQVKSNIKSMAQVSQPGELKISNTGHPAKAKAAAAKQTEAKPAEVKAVEQELAVPKIEESVKAAEEMIEQEKVEAAQPDIKPTSRAMDRAPVEVPVDNIKLSKDVSQFKAGADPKTGVVEPLGKYKRFPDRTENPIMLWKRLNGDIEVVSGRHRLHSAKTSGEKTIPSQIWEEADGYTAAQMAELDAASNIQDGNGTIQDYAQYIRNRYDHLTPEQARTAADSASLLGRASGRAGFEIGVNSSDALYSALLRGNVKGLTVNKAAIIAKAAPLDDDLQRAALKMVASLTEEAIPGFIAKVSRIPRNELQLDLFGDNDQVLVDAVKVAKAAIAKQKELQEQINLVSNNVRKQEESAALGVPVTDIEFTKAKLAALEAEKARVSNFTSDEDVQAELGGTPRRNVELPVVSGDFDGSYSEEQRLRVQAENPGMSMSNVRRVLEGKSPRTETKREESRANDRKDLLDIGFGWEVGEEGITVTPDQWNKATAVQQKAWEEEWASADTREGIDTGRTIDTVGEDNLFAENELPFNLQGEEDITPLLQKQVDDRNAAAGSKRAADAAQLDMFAETSQGVTGTEESRVQKMPDIIKGYNAIQDPKESMQFLMDEIKGVRDPETLKAIADTGFNYARMFVARNPNTDPETLVDLATDNNNFTKASVAQHPNTPVAQLKVWAESTDPGLRMYAAMSPNLTAELREKLSKDESSSVRVIIADPQEKYLLSRTGPAVEIKATPSIGRGKEHFARIQSAVESVARLYPDRKMRFVEKASELPRVSNGDASTNTDGQVEAYFDPNTNEMVFVTDNIRDEVRAAKLLFHEATHGNVARMELNPEAKTGLDDVLSRSKATLQREVPQILKDGGYKSLDEMAFAYGYDRNTEEGKRLLQGEVVARFAERIANDPKPPVWWKRMLSDLKLWFKKHFNITMSAKDLEYFLRSEMGSVGNTTGAFEARILKSQTQQLQEVTVADAKRMGVPELARAAEIIQGMSSKDERYNAMLDIIQDEILRRAIRADRPTGGSVTIDKRWADRVATNPEGTFNPDAFEAALAERVADGNAVYVQAGADAEPIVAIIGGQIITESGEIPLSKLILSTDKIFTRPTSEPEYLKPGERRGQQDPKNVPATNDSNVDEPTPDRWDKAQYLLHEKLLKPLFGEKDGPNQRGGAFGSGPISKEVRDLINSKNQFIASKVKAVEFRWKEFDAAVKKAFPAGTEGVQKLLNTAQGIIANTIDADQNRRAGAIGRDQYALAQARWIQKNKPQFMNAIATLDTQSKRNAYLKGKLNAAEFNQMNSQANTAQNESRKNAIGAFRLDNYNKAKAAKVAALQQLPQEVVDAIQSMSLAIDELMTYGVKNKLITSRMSAAVGDQPGLYLVRTYHLLDNPEFRAKVKAGKALRPETQRLTEWVHTQLINNEAKNILAANAARMMLDPTEPLLSLKEARIAASVSEATGKDRVLAYVRELQDVKYEDQAYTVLDNLLDESSKELGLPQEVMDAWGMHTDIGANFTKTMTRVAQDIATTEMMRDLLKLGTEQGFLVDPSTGAIVPEGFVKLSPIGEYGAMRELDGFYARPGFKKYFEQYYDPAEVKLPFKIMANVALATTLVKTVLSLPSLSVNFLSNSATAIVAGHGMNAVTGGGMMSGVATGWASLRGKSSKEVQAYVEKCIRLGVFGDNVGPQMAKEIMLQASRSIDDIDTDLTKSLLNPDYKWHKSLSGITRKVIDFRGRLYGMGDEIWKVNGFEAEIKEIEAHEAYLEAKDAGDGDIEPGYKFVSVRTLGLEADRLAIIAEATKSPASEAAAAKAKADYEMAQAQIEQRAADYARDAYPTYDLAPQFVKDLKAVPFLGQFMTFSAAMARTVKRVSERAVQDIRSDDEFLQHRGYMTLGRMAAVVAAPSALAMFSAIAMGISDEEEEALRASLPAWQRNATLIFLGKDEKGSIRYWDTSRLDPYKMFKEPFFAAISALDGDVTNAPGAVVSGVATAAKPWLGVDIATGSMLEAFYNNKGDGARVYNPEDPDAWKSVMGHIWKGFEPGDLTMVRNLTKGAIGESDMAAEIASAFGFRSNVNDPIKSLGFSTWKATTRLRDANTLLLRAMNKGEDIEGAFESANEARENIIKPLWTQYHAAIKRGVSEEEADAMLKEQRVSKDMLAQIKGGYLLPYKPGAQAMKKAEKATADEVESLLKNTERVYFEEP